MFFKTAIKSTASHFGNASLRFQQNKTVKGITSGLVNLIPLVLIGSICFAVSNLPIPAMHEFLNSVTNNQWTLVSNIINFATVDIIALAALLSVSFSLAVQNDFMRKHKISAFFPSLTALVCYVILLVWDPALYNAIPAGETAEVLFGNAGKNSVFSALFVAVISVYLFLAFAKLWQKLPWFQWRAVESHQQILTAIRTIFPLVCAIACFVVLRVLTEWFINATEIEQHLRTATVHLISEGTLFSVVALVLLMQILWFFGAHGTNTIESIMDQVQAGSIIDTAGSSSATAAAQTIDPSTMFSNADFFEIFVDMGGTGTGMALLLALLVFGAAARGRRLARISAFPVAFNANETLLFGVPIVLNPFFLIPFVLAPVVAAAVSYGAFALGIVPPMVNHVEWTTPILLSGYMSTGSAAGSLLQLVCVCLAFLLYAPFVVSMKRTVESHQLKTFDEFKKEASWAAKNAQDSLARRNDDIGEMTRDFITEINTFFEVGRIPFHMVYQPKTDVLGRVVGVEALLRWTHPRYGPVPPDILVELADEAGLSTQLGRWITSQTLEELALWRQEKAPCTALSINLNPRHLYLDKEYPDFLGEEMKRLKINPTLVDLEITEHMAVHANEAILTLFQQLHSLGVGLSIDDMGMGYSSLMYISDFGVSVVKIDISLIDGVVTNVQQQEIVRSVIELAQQINLAVIVEGVEAREQVEALAKLGCRYFQGYYFSKPLEPEELRDFVSEHGTAPFMHEGTEQTE